MTSIRPSGLNQSPFMEIEDITSIEDVSIEFEENTTSNGKKTLIPDNMATTKTPRTSGSLTAMNIYTELKNKREEELLETIEELRKTITKLETEISGMKKAEEMRKSDDERSIKKRKLREDDYENVKEDSSLQKTVEDLTEKLAKQDKELFEAREKIAESEYTDHSETADGKITNKDFFEKVSTLFESKMKAFENRFDAMEKKMEKNIEHTKSYSEAVAKTKSPNMQDNVTNFRGIALAAKIEDMNEESDKKNREMNIIVKGKQEIDEMDDKAFLESLIKELCIGAVHPTSVMRIGTKVEGRNRPIKVIFKSSDEKHKVLSNLKNLKGKELYKTISVTHDYTFNEREMLDDFLRQAKEKNELDTMEDKDYKWKVWGSPKNRLFLKKVKMNKVGNSPA